MEKSELLEGDRGFGEKNAVEKEIVRWRNTVQPRLIPIPLETTMSEIQNLLIQLADMSPAAISERLKAANSPTLTRAEVLLNVMDELSPHTKNFLGRSFVKITPRQRAATVTTPIPDTVFNWLAGD